ncbi:hypothetical protein [Acinetobacter baumannii]|uniref:hypothetical protein n=1 Tax=Acinetobacter baumannii TaxID=470 RepID=UPI0038924B59
MLILIGMALVALSVYRGISLGRDLEGSSVTQLSNSMYIRKHPANTALPSDPISLNLVPT